MICDRHVCWLVSHLLCGQLRVLSAVVGRNIAADITGLYLVVVLWILSIHRAPLVKAFGLYYSCEAAAAG